MTGKLSLDPQHLKRVAQLLRAHTAQTMLTATASRPLKLRAAGTVSLDIDRNRP
jgi:hypothetical protein